MTSDNVPESSDPPKAQNSTITASTVLSQQPLIIGVRAKKPDYALKIQEKLKCDVNFSLTYLGVLQILFGFLMAGFGILVIVNKSELAQMGAGLWGSSFAFASGVTGLMARSKTRCPLKDDSRKLLNTVFLVFSLVSIAVSQLVLVIASIGLARDIEKQNQNESDRKEIEENSMVLLSNVGLIIVSGLECLCAIITSYKCSKIVCPCFEQQPEAGDQQVVNSKEVLLNSWLGKHHFQPGTPPPMYVVANPSYPSTLDRRSQHPAVLPIVQFPPPQPRVMGYPLIPAPLGPIPSPTIWPQPQKMAKRRHHKKRRSNDHNTQKVISMKQKASKQKPKKKQITTEEVIKSYTGLDRVIAEEFIEICDSYSNLVSSSSGQSSIQSTTAAAPPKEQQS